ncbi:unnamed protein product [Arctogadus glacialis]
MPLKLGEPRLTSQPPKRIAPWTVSLQGAGRGAFTEMRVGSTRAQCQALEKNGQNQLEQAQQMCVEKKEHAADTEDRC